MPYVPGCQFDLFISYASEDNVGGWVERFQKALLEQIGHKLGRLFSEKEVFFDKTTLRTNQNFTNELRTKAANSAVLVVVLSPHWMTSDWCHQERLSFLTRLPRGASKEECLTVVLARPVDDSKLDPLLKTEQRYSFFDADSNSLPEVSSAEGEKRIKDLAGQVAKALSGLRQKCKPVFLGRACNEASGELRKRLTAELGKEYYRVEPEANTEFEDPGKLKKLMAECGVRVHLLGEMGDDAYQAAETSAGIAEGTTVIVQPYASAELTADEELWLAEMVSPKPGKIAPQIVRGKTDQGVVDIVKEELGRLSAGPRAEAGRADIGVVCGKPDYGFAHELKQKIEAAGVFQVECPAFLKELTGAFQIVRAWRGFMKSSESLVMFWGDAKWDDLEKIWKCAQEHHSGKKCWYVRPPEIADKLERFPDAMREEGDEASLKSFLGQIKKVTK